MARDYGFYGKGLSGYAHYMQAVKESQKGGGGRKQPSGSGCLVILLAMLALVGAVVLFFSL